MKNKEDARTRCVHVLFAINPESKKHKSWKWQVFWLTPVIERLPILSGQWPMDSWQWRVFFCCLLSVVCCLSNSGKSVVQYVFLFLPLLKERVGVRLESTAAGTVPEFDRIPFYQSNEGCFDTKICCKSMKKILLSLI